MATIAQHAQTPIARERRFFFAMALLLIAAALLGFGYFQYAGISSWGAPWWVHVHAFSQMGWLGFYAAQNLLVVQGNVALHRRLGLFGAVYGAWLILCGMGLSVAIIATGGGDGMFTPAVLLALNGSTILGFAVLFAAALRQRAQSDWHKRLMLCALIAISLPSFGRILVMLGIPSTLNRALVLLCVMAIGMLFDRRVRGKVHPAYLYGAATVVAMGLLQWGLPLFAPFAALANAIAS